MLELLAKRRSIRKYKNIAIEKEKVNKLIKAALLAPSSRGIRPWEFIIVEDVDILNKLSKSKTNGSVFLSDAPLGIVIIADNTKSDVWVEDSSIASVIIQLQAEAMDLGSCWIQIRNRMHDDKVNSEEYIRGVLNIPQNYSVEAIISIGYPNESKKAYDESELKYDKIHKEKF
jgi:nitroreductase